MSHDQRPGKLRVVSDARAPQRRSTDPVTIDGRAVTVTGESAGPEGAVTATADSSGKRLPLVQIALFLVACMIGGVAVALVRPFGLG